jgi:hypothetical protein
VAVKDVQSDERKDILVQIEIPALPAPACTFLVFTTHAHLCLVHILCALMVRTANAPLLSAELSYFSVISNVQEVSRATAAIDRPGTIVKICSDTRNRSIMDCVAADAPAERVDDANINLEIDVQINRHIVTSTRSLSSQKRRKRGERGERETC